jgi:class 3 adenylate cyclase
MRELFTGLDGPRAPPQRLRLIAWVRLGLVVPGIYGVALLDHLGEIRKHPDSHALRVILALWLVLFISYLPANAAIIGWSGRRPRLAASLSLYAIGVDVATTQLSQGRHGAVFTNFIWAIIIAVGYRASLDYASAALAGLLTLALYFASIGLELCHAVPIAPADDVFPAAYAAPIALIAYVVQNVAILAIVFGAVNYGANQSLKLHRYITQTVLQRYLPPALVARAAAGELRLDEPPARRTVTVLFMDLVGFTTMSERLGAERVAVVLNRYLTRMSELAREHGATVDKFIGDAVMLVFGAPEPMAPESQARASIALALEIQRAMVAFEDPPLRVRIGVNTGEAVVGHFGSPIRSDFTVIGPAVNVAARLESAGKPGRILIGESTARLLGESYPLEPAGQLTLKGVAEPVTAYFVGPAA